MPTCVHRLCLCFSLSFFTALLLYILATRGLFVSFLSLGFYRQFVGNTQLDLTRLSPSHIKASDSTRVYIPVISRIIVETARFRLDSGQIYPWFKYEPATRPSSAISAYTADATVTYRPTRPVTSTQQPAATWT